MSSMIQEEEEDMASLPSSLEVEEEEHVKWGENVERELAPGCTPSKVWEFLGSFSGLHRWLLSIQVCQLVEGEDGVPGAVRFCSGRPPRCSPSTPPICVTEKLLSYNLPERSFSYSIVDSSYGFRNYVSRFSVLSSSPSHSSSESEESSEPSDYSQRTIIKWSFELSPVPARSRSDVIDFLLSIFDRMISNLETAVLAASSPTPPSLPHPPTSAPSAHASNNTSISTSLCVKAN